MFAFLKMLAGVFHLTDAVAHWRLTTVLCVGVAIACGSWALIPDRVTGTVVWLVVIGVAAILGVIWDRRTNGRTTT